MPLTLFLFLKRKAHTCKNLLKNHEQLLIIKTWFYYVN
nr:RNA polymerase alpha subunit [Kalinella pachyderma]WDY12912.1 RNA polymerase alpha subunit [Kalinella pachyderma]